jgi:hypothetical protein
VANGSAMDGANSVTAAALACVAVITAVECELPDGLGGAHGSGSASGDAAGSAGGVDGTKSCDARAVGSFRFFEGF